MMFNLVQGRSVLKKNKNKECGGEESEKLIMAHVTLLLPCCYMKKNIYATGVYFDFSFSYSLHLYNMQI